MDLKKNSYGKMGVGERNNSKKKKETIKTQPVPHRETVLIPRLTVALPY